MLKHYKKSLHKLFGFALSLDVAVVVVCVCLLLLAGLVGFQSYVKSAKINRAQADCACLALAISQYAYDLQNAYPSYNAGQCLPANLVALESKHTASGKGPWLSGNAMKKSGSSYLDPWGHVYVYDHGSGNDGTFVVYSKGPDNNGSMTRAGVASNNAVGASGGFSR